MPAQFAAARVAAQPIVALLRAGWRVVLTHGNGPQVGHILLRAEAAEGEAYPITLATAVAESDGEVGYILQQSLHNALREADLSQTVVTVLTQTVVDAADPGFTNPTKPIGPAHDDDDAERLRVAGVPLVSVSGHGWRRVVASPDPIEVVQSWFDASFAVATADGIYNHVGDRDALIAYDSVLTGLLAEAFPSVWRHACPV